MSRGAAAAPPMPPAMSVANGGAALRRVRLRGALSMLVGIAAGLVTFAVIAGWPATAHLLTSRPGASDDMASGAASERQALVLTEANRGQVLFGRYCDSCHYGGNENIGSSLRSPQFKRAFNTPESIAAFVRKGGFDMPAYPPSFLSDAELQAITEYVVALPEASR